MKALPVFIPSEGKLPTAEELESYAKISPEFPEFFLETCRVELRRNYHYQMVAIIGGWLYSVVLVVAFVFLVSTGHKLGAGAVIGANVIGVAGKLFAKAQRGNKSA